MANLGSNTHKVLQDLAKLVTTQKNQASLISKALEGQKHKIEFLHSVSCKFPSSWQKVDQALEFFADANQEFSDIIKFYHNNEQNPVYKLAQKAISICDRINMEQISEVTSYAQCTNKKLDIINKETEILQTLNVASLVLKKLEKADELSDNIETNWDLIKQLTADSSDLPLFSDN